VELKRIDVTKVDRIFAKNTIEDILEALKEDKD
jgi:hypothetical protein